MHKVEYEIRSAIAAHRLAVKSGVQVLHGGRGYQVRVFSSS